MFKRTLYLLVAATFSTLAVTAHATQGEGTAMAREGVVRCTGANFLRLGNSEVHYTAYSLVNVDATTAVTINRMRFFDAQGNVLFDSASSTLPASQGGLIGPANNSLGPNQAVQFIGTDFLPFLPETQRPGQLEIEWSAARRVLTLAVHGN